MESILLPCYWNTGKTLNYLLIVKIKFGWQRDSFEKYVMKWLNYWSRALVSITKVLNRRLNGAIFKLRLYYRSVRCNFLNRLNKGHYKGTSLIILTLTQLWDADTDKQVQDKWLWLEDLVAFFHDVPLKYEGTLLSQVSIGGFHGQTCSTLHSVKSWNVDNQG